MLYAKSGLTSETVCGAIGGAGSLIVPATRFTAAAAFETGSVVGQIQGRTSRYGGADRFAAPTAQHADSLPAFGALLIAVISPGTGRLFVATRIAGHTATHASFLMANQVAVASLSGAARHLFLPAGLTDIIPADQSVLAQIPFRATKVAISAATAIRTASGLIRINRRLAARQPFITDRILVHATAHILKAALVHPQDFILPIDLLMRRLQAIPNSTAGKAK